jgi:hypothetical protein
VKGRGPSTFHNPLDGLRYARIPDPDRHQTLLVLYPVPLVDNVWGTMLPLKDTSWGAQVPTVTGDALSHALHGRPKPLREMLGVPPYVRGQRLEPEDRMCMEAQQGICGMASPACYPGSTKLPECYVCPTEDRTLRALGTAVARAWDEGRYVFVVEGPEFIVR